MKNPLGRRRFMAVVGTGIAASSVLATCQAAPPTLVPPSPTPPPPPPKAPTPIAAVKAAEPTKPAAPSPTAAVRPIATTPSPVAKPPAAVRVVISMGREPDTLMPRLGSMMARAEVLGALHVDPVTTDDKGEYVALLAQRVPTFENGDANMVAEGDDRHLEATFRLRPGFKWHDGQPVTARDARFYWELMMNPDFKVSNRDVEMRIQDVEVVDDVTFVVKYRSAKQAREAATNGFMGLPAAEFEDWKQQREPITYRLFPLAAGILPQHILGQIPAADIEKHEFTRRPILAGPYKFREWVPDESITVEANPDYPLGVPKIQTAVFRIIKDPNRQLAALQAGEVDVVTQVEGIDVDKAPELDRIEAAGEFKVYYVPGSPWELIDFNLDAPHLQEKSVRKAIGHGINREQLVERVLFGKTRVAHSWVQPGIPPWAWDESCLVKYAFDPNRARALLQEAGYAPGADNIMARDGSRLALKLQTTDLALRKNTAQVIEQQLRAIGIHVELEFMPGPQLFGNDGPLRQRTFQMAMYTWLSQADPDRIDYMHSRNIPRPENNFQGNNFPGYRNARVDELSARGAATINTTEAAPIYCEMQRLWTEDLPVLPLFQRVVVTVARSRLQNFRPTPTSTVETWNIHEWAMS